MSYALVIPLEYLEKLVKSREYFEQSIRNQILEAIKCYIEAMEVEVMEKMV